MLAIRLTEDIEKRLDALVKATARTITFYACQAILEHLDDLEGLYLAEPTSDRSSCRTAWHPGYGIHVA